MADAHPFIALQKDSMRVTREPDGQTVTIEFDIDGETTAYWRNLFVEALWRWHGFRIATARAKNGTIRIERLPREHQEAAARVVAAAVHEANASVRHG